MTKATVRSLSMGLGFALALGTVYAQPAKKQHHHTGGGSGSGSATAAGSGSGSAAPAAGSGSGSAQGSGSDATAAGSGAGSGSGTPVTKVGVDESLQSGGDTRPWAAGVKQSEQQAALVLFHDGNVMLNDGLFAKAADKYKAALTHWDHPAVHYNLALADMNLDQPIDAYDNFSASVKFGDAPLQSRDKYDHAKEYMVLLDKQIAEVEVTCNKPGAKISIDDKDVFTAPGTYKGKVRAGPHKFIATLEGHPTRVDATYVTPGAPFRIELKLYTTAELTRYKRKWDATWIPYAVMGGGVLVGAIGGILELAASNNYKQYDDKVAACNMTSMNAGCAQSSDLQSLRDSGDTKKTAGFVMYGIGAAAIATGAVLWILNRPESYEVRPEDLNTPITFAPVVSPTFAGAALSGRF